MGISSQFFNEQINTCLSEISGIEEQLRSILAQIDDAKIRKSSLLDRLSNSDSVFNVDSYEVSTGYDSIDNLDLLISNLEAEAFSLKSDLDSSNSKLEELRVLYSDSLKKTRSSKSEVTRDTKDFLRFILKLIDTDPLRAKLEIENFLGEDK